jgi:hypothetical protein
MSQEASPQERIGAFFTAVDEEVLRPLRRYVRGFRRGVVVGIVLGLLLTPISGREVRARVLRLAPFCCRRGKRA